MTAAASTLERIRRRRCRAGLASEAELAGMTEQQIQQFIFKAGFSTAAQVTSVSGRGVGMDVVRTNIEKIGGTVEMKSQRGQGLDLHHQDPAHPRHRLGADRRMRRRALRHPADQRGRAGARRGQVRAPASSGSTTRRCCACATGCCRWSRCTGC